MNFSKISLLVLIFFVSGCSVSERLEEVKPLVEDFQALYNERSFSSLYDTLIHSHWRDIDDIEAFTEKMNKIRDLTGKRLSGVRAGFNWKSTISTGTTVVVSFNSKFINGSGLETFTFKSEDDLLKVFGYTFTPAAGFKANQADTA